MRFLFDPDSALMRILGRVADLLILNVVFLLTCLPVFTIGAANTALYTVIFRMDTSKEGKLIAEYFRAFRENFRQSTVIWLILLVFGIASVVNMTQSSAIGGPVGYLLLVFSTMVLVVLFMVFSYAFPLLSQFQNTSKNTLKNALLLAVGHLPRTLLLLVLNVFPWALMLVNLYTFVQLGFLWLILYFAVIAYMASRILFPVFRPYWDPQE